MMDTMTIEILKDGTIKTTTDPISPANHDSAERFLKTLADLAGGETTRVKRTDPEALKRAHQHHHDHGHSHVHAPVQGIVKGGG